jgi:hypothetical protein
MNKRTAGLAALATVLVSGAFAQIALQPGRYEGATEMTLPGAPEPLTFETVECIAPEQAANVVALFVQEFTEEGDESCTIANLNTTGSKIAFDVTCQIGDGVMRGRAEMTFAGGTYEGTGTMRMPDGSVFTSHTRARRVGECTGTEDDE